MARLWARRIRRFALAKRRQEVFVPIFRSGPVSNGRLARSHLQCSRGCVYRDQSRQ
jgi:hypothetical protein